MKKFISMCLALILVFCVSGCGNTSSDRPSAQTVVENAIDAVKSADMENISKYWGNTFTDTSLSETDSEIMKSIFNGISYKIISAEEGDTAATVKVNISNIDAASALSDTMSEAISKLLSSAFSGSEMSEDEQNEMMNSMFIEKLKSGNYQTVEKDVSINLTLENDEWAIDKNMTDAYDALTGGLFTFADNLSDLGETDDPSEEDFVWHDVPLGQEVELATIKIRVTKCEELQSLSAEYFDPDIAQDGTKYVVFSVDIENTTKDTISFSNDLSLTDSQGRTYQCYSNAMWYYDETFVYTDLSPNIVKSGVFVYNVPSDSTGYYLSTAKAGTSDAFRLYGN